MRTVARPNRYRELISASGPKRLRDASHTVCLTASTRYSLCASNRLRPDTFVQMNDQVN
jgi:hypothetical protein